jgi:hypothetical protein
MFTGLKSYNNFVGCLKYAFFNDISILYELKKGNPKVHYIGVLEPEMYETDVDVIPITFPFPSSYIWWPNRQTDNFTLKFSFKSNRSMAVLASSSVTTATGNGYWEVSLSVLWAANIRSNVSIWLSLCCFIPIYVCVNNGKKVVGLNSLA